MSERKGCWGCLGGLFTVLAVGYVILKWASMPLPFIQAWMDVEQEEKRQKADAAQTAKIAAEIEETFLVKEEDSGVRVLLFKNKSYLLYYPTVKTVTKGKAADRAGMKEDDRILRIDGKSVLDMFDESIEFDKSLKACRSKSVPVLVMRGSERVKLTLDVPADGVIGIQLDMLKKKQ